MDRTAKIWDVTSGHLLATFLTDGTANYPIAAFSPNGQYLAIKLGKELTRLYEISGLTQQTPLACQLLPVQAIAVAPERGRFACISQDRFQINPVHQREAVLTEWRLPEGENVSPTLVRRKLIPSPAGDRILPRSASVIYHPGGKHLVYNSELGQGFHVLDLTNGVEASYTKMLVNDKLTFDPSGKRLWATVKYQQDRKTGRLTELDTDRIVSVGFPDMSVLQRVDSGREQLLRNFQLFTDIAAGKKWTMIGSRGGTIRALPTDVTPGSEPMGFTLGLQSPINGVAVHPDETMAAWVTEGGDAGALHVVGLPDQSRILPTPLPLRAAGTALAFSPDGEHLAVGLQDGLIKLFRIHGNQIQEVLELTSPTGVKKIVFILQGKNHEETLITLGTNERGVRTWNLGSLRNDLSTLRLNW